MLAALALSIGCPLDFFIAFSLQAPPGAGKTTVVPLALLRHGPDYLAAGQKILVLEPRRVAAKAAARRMAALLGESVGGTVGYRYAYVFSCASFTVWVNCIVTVVTSRTACSYSLYFNVDFWGFQLQAFELMVKQQSCRCFA